MSRISSLYLQDIVDCCEKVRAYLSGTTFDDFILDNMRVDAVARNLEIIGEAVKNLPEDVRNIRPDIEWKKVARFRDVIAHHYFKVDFERVWSITQTNIEEIESAAKEMLADRAEIEEID